MSRPGVAAAVLAELRASAPEDAAEMDALDKVAAAVQSGQVTRRPSRKSEPAVGLAEPASEPLRVELRSGSGAERSSERDLDAIASGARRSTAR